MLYIEFWDFFMYGPVTLVLTFEILLLILVRNLSVSYISHLFLATEVVTVFVFQEPSLLSSLQDNGLTDVMLHALLIKDVSLFCCSVKNSQLITPFYKIHIHTKSSLMA